MQVCYDEFGPLLTTADFSRALKLTNPTISLTDFREMLSYPKMTFRARLDTKLSSTLAFQSAFQEMLHRSWRPAESADLQFPERAIPPYMPSWSKLVLQPPEQAAPVQPDSLSSPQPSEQELRVEL